MGYSRYDRFARIYDFILAPVEKRVLDPIRREYVPKIRGLTLDVASGTGHNIKYYPDGASVFLVDKSRKMIELSKAKGKKQSNGANLEFFVAEIEKLPFEDNTFDTVLSIDVLCSVKDFKVALEEIKRVLKPKGRVIFVEHGKTGKHWKDSSLYLLNLITYTVVGSSMIREPVKAIGKSGFKIYELKELAGSFKYIMCGK